MHEEPARRTRRPSRVALAALGVVAGAAVAGASIALGALLEDPGAARRLDPAAAGASSAQRVPSDGPLAGVDWKEASAVGFLELGSARLADAASLDRAWVESMTASLTAGTPAEIQARAASLLGAAAGRVDVASTTREAALSALLLHLEARRAAGSRGAVGSALIAAAAMARTQAVPQDVPRRLATLAVGGSPHPDLPVRVECAATALQRASEPALRRDMSAFLLAVLRAETPDQGRSPRSWERVTTLAWVKTRAAQALSRAAGTELRFRPDGSWAHQTAEADRLERELQSVASRR